MRTRELLADTKRRAKAFLRPLLAAVSGSGADLAPDLWRLSRSSEHGLTLEGVVLHELLATWGSPLHVVHAATLRANAQKFQHVPAGSETGCEVFYSYKTNPIPGVLRELHQQGLGAEVISAYELWLAERLGVPADRTIYNGPGKSDDSIRTAIERGILAINCNHREEIARIARLAREVGRRARVGIRVSTDASWSQQFGAPISGGQAFIAFAEAQASGVLDVVGLHAHRGGMLRAESEVLEFTEPLFALLDRLERELSLDLELLNFGGSLGTPTVESLDPRARKLNQALHLDLRAPSVEHALPIERYVEVLVRRVEDYYRSRGKNRPRILIEPGRAVTGNSQFLLATVLTTKALEGASCLVLDAGVNLAESVRAEYHQLLPVNRCGEGPLRVHSVVGPICSPMDTLYAAVRLPALEAGDSVAIMDAGAYFVPFSTSFSFPRPAIVMIDEGQVTLLRRRETFEDLVRCDEPDAERPGAGLPGTEPLAPSVSRSF